jgi:hypothetical protein
VIRHRDYTPVAGKSVGVTKPLRQVGLTRAGIDTFVTTQTVVE